MERDITPNRTAFLTYKLLIRLIIITFILGILYYFIRTLINFPAVLLVYVIIIFLSYLDIKIRYDKEKYFFYENRIVHNEGTIFSDNQTDLSVRNITHVTLKLPFIENKVFKTGSVNIQAAGSGLTEIDLKSVDNPEQVYGFVKELMKSNGFRLKKENLVQKESPHDLAVFFETFTKFFGGLLTAVFFIGLYTGGRAFELAFNYPVISIPVIGTGLIGYLIFTVISFLDLKNRVYEVYSDTISYTEGFLTKNYAFMPVENLADSESKQTVVDKIFGLYDVKISCQGSGSEILFKNMAHGKELEDNIDRLISRSDNVLTEKTESTSKHSESALKTYHMDIPRTMATFLIIILAAILIVTPFAIAVRGPFFLGLIPFILLVVLVPTFLISYFKAKFTTFIVKETSMEEKYDFIFSSATEFSNEKITGVIFKKNPLDMIMKTLSIEFWSIGSNKTINFANIKEDDTVKKDILRRLNYSEDKKLYSLKPSFSFREMLKSNFYLTALSLILLSLSAILGILVFGILAIVFMILYTIIYIYKKYYYRQSELIFYKEFAYLRQGLFFRKEYYAFFGNIQDITTVRYPFSNLGNIAFNVAGEKLVTQGKSSQQSYSSYGFKLNYADDIRNKDELIDIIFYRRPSAPEIAELEKNIPPAKAILKTKPSLANYIFPVIVISILLPFLILVLPLTLPLTIWYVKVISYKIEDFRIIAQSGILYKKQKSIVFSKINHISKKQGLLNKLFSNGSVKIYTTGSSASEIQVNNISDYREFYETLKEHY